MNGAEAMAYPPDAPAEVESVAARCARLASWADELAAGLAGDTHRLGAAWRGPAATACRDELARVARLVGSLAGPLHAAALLLRCHAARVEEARGRVDRLRGAYDQLVLAHQRENDVAPDLPGPLRGLWGRDRELAQAAELARLVGRHQEVMLELAADARRTAGQVVAAARGVLPHRPPTGRPVTDLEADLAASLPLLAATRRAVGVPGGTPPAPRTPPREVRAWWAALTTDEQDRLVAARPRRLGTLDGLPAAARSRANEQLLGSVVEALLARTGRTGDQQRRLDTCLLVRDRVAALRSRRDPVTQEPLEVQLLVFEPAEFGAAGRVVVGIGDVDTADHVAVLVPGLGSGPRAELGPLTRDALRVRSESRRASPATRTATVAWLGYDPPEGWRVARDGAAARGADLLAADLLALQEARDRLPHLTVVGHSYGSTVAGTALRDHRTGTDDAVLLGSPGPNVETAAELRVPPGHVFVGASSRDPVSYLDHFGADPSHQDFGAVRFRAEDVSRNPWRLDLADHSKYLAPRTESLANVARVVVGDDDAVRRAAYRGEAWLRPDGINDDPEADRDPAARR